MQALRKLALVMALSIGSALLLAACGGSTKTVTVSSAPLTPQTTSTTQPSTATTSTQTTQTQKTQSTPSSTGTSTTRSAPEPKFTEGEKTAESATGAAAILRTHGYTPNDASEYHSDQALGVMVGTRTGSADGYAQQAFFFVNGKYLGTDTKEPSASVKVVSQGDTEVTLRYALYRPNDPLVNPGGGEARVTFQLNNGKLVALQKIPPAHSSTGVSRN